MVEPIAEAFRNGQLAHENEPSEVEGEDEQLDHAEDQADQREGDLDSEGQETADLPRPLSLTSPDRMKLTEEERNLAINIKEAIAATPDVDPVSDFMCAQLALIDGDNTESAIERAHHLQCFREEYGILDNATDGTKCFSRFIDLFPCFHLSFTFYHDTGKYVMIYDNTKFDIAQIKTQEAMQTWLGGTYYTCVIFSPDFEAIRNGTTLVAECEGYDWTNGMDFKSLKKVWSEIAAVYPVSFDRIKYFNSTTTMNVVTSMLKPFLPENL